MITTIGSQTSFYISRYIGLSIDVKPTSCDPGSEFTELDTGRKYVWDGSTWTQVKNLVAVSGSQAQIGVDQAAAFANSATQYTQVNVDFAAPATTRPRYKITVYNPSAVTDLTIKVMSKALSLGGDTRYSLIDIIVIPKSQSITGATVNSYVKFIEGIFVGTDLRLIVCNNTALGASDGFSAYIRIREAG